MRSSRSAFTLTEMLIAVILLTLLIATALFAFRYQLLTFKRIEPAALDKALSYHWLRSSIQSMQYYVLDRYDRYGDAKKELYFYFEGTPEEMNYITKSPNFSDVTSIVRVKCEGENLVYTEEPLFSGGDYLRPAIKTSSPSKVLFSELSGCFIRYFSETDVQETLSQKIPRSVEINLEHNEGHFSIYTSVRADNNVTLARIRDMQRDQ